MDDFSADIGDEGATSGVEGEWNQSWPEQWQDTQILIIEIDGQQANVKILVECSLVKRWPDT